MFRRTEKIVSKPHFGFDNNAVLTVKYNDGLFPTMLVMTSVRRIQSRTCNLFANLPTF